jgi:hypothetical protein
MFIGYLRVRSWVLRLIFKVIKWYGVLVFLVFCNKSGMRKEGIMSVKMALKKSQCLWGVVKKAT